MPTFNEVSSLQLRSLCNALSLERSYPEFLLVQRFLFEPWGDRPIPPRPLYRSVVGDDHSPYEYSIAFAPHGVELRLLLEAQGSPPDRSSNHATALQLTSRLADVFSLDLSRFEAVADLLCSSEPSSPFSMWHAVSLRPGRPPGFKIYLNPNVRGKTLAHEVIAEAFRRLGIQAALPHLHHGLNWRGQDLDELAYFSLDLSSEPDARVKVYFCHHSVTAEELERYFAVAPSHQPGDVRAFCHDMVGHQGPFIRKPVSSCFSFVVGNDDPTSATLHLPISHYASSDLAIAERVSSVLGKHRQKSEVYGGLIDAYPSRSLAFGTGIQSYTSFRREKGELRFTVYLSPGLYHGVDGLEHFQQQAISRVVPALANEPAEARGASMKNSMEIPM